MRTQAVSEAFVRYYRELGFEKLSGTSLLHDSIPMTFVMSAGLAQVETAMHELRAQAVHDDYVLVQNCFRHFDVDKIGQSALHLSLFEMPGAFSFGQNSRCLTVRRMRCSCRFRDTFRIPCDSSTKQVSYPVRPSIPIRPFA